MRSPSRRARRPWAIIQATMPVATTYGITLETVSAVPVEVVSTMMTRAAASARYATPQTRV
jgi:hypothetical protein